MMAQPLDPELLDILVCPESHARLVQVDDWLYSTDPGTRRRYPIRDGIPIMLIDESQVVDEAEFQRVIQQGQQETQETTPNG
jgi:uncharacterized protein YbaR (Trm112 family)